MHHGHTYSCYSQCYATYSLLLLILVITNDYKADSFFAIIISYHWESIRWTCWHYYRFFFHFTIQSCLTCSIADFRFWVTVSFFRVSLAFCSLSPVATKAFTRSADISVSWKRVPLMMMKFLEWPPLSYFVVDKSYIK